MGKGSLDFRTASRLHDELRFFVEELVHFRGVRKHVRRGVELSARVKDDASRTPLREIRRERALALSGEPDDDDYHCTFAPGSGSAGAGGLGIVTTFDSASALARALRSVTFCKVIVERSVARAISSCHFRNQAEQYLFSTRAVGGVRSSTSCGV